METIMPGVTPTFLYPMLMQYPVDPVCQSIVLALEKRNWDVPGITVKFRVYGTGAEKYRMVSEVRGAEFRLYFSRKQSILPGGTWNDIAAVHNIIIPKIDISVFEDESGPSLDYYVGGNWKRDREWFFTGSKVNSKLNGEPRRYLQYTGSRFKPGEGNGTYIPGRRMPYLVHTNDLGREYDPKCGEPTFFETEAFLREVSDWLKQNVLAEIEKQPVAKKQVGFTPEPLIPGVVFPQIYTVCEWDDAERIMQGKQDMASLVPKDRFGLIGSGYRLVNLGTKDDGTFPKVAYEGFLWCRVGNPAELQTQEDIEIPHWYVDSLKNDSFVRITPKYANHIYVIDGDASESWKKAFFEAHPNQERLSNAELGEYYRVAARTLVPISEYKGTYTNPVVLIARELELDEVELITKVKDLPKRERKTA